MKLKRGVGSTPTQPAYSSCSILVMYCPGMTTSPTYRFVNSTCSGAPPPCAAAVWSSESGGGRYSWVKTRTILQSCCHRQCQHVFRRFLREDAIFYLVGAFELANEFTFISDLDTKRLCQVLLEILCSFFLCDGCHCLDVEVK